ncbi:unnamed protein product [Rhizoctonia solani]|uniref:Uncharacterized protein n=1 Tax=Rhizoctonia solani TaxID=456999 RepID=A0A8H3B5R8_9AGAM|nr:unnamed protein product [Rhizoctonia solani]
MMRLSTNLGARRTFSLLASRNLAQTPMSIYSRPSVMALASRGVADDVKNKAKQLAEEPGNVLQSAKDELKNVGGDLAKTIAGNVQREFPVDNKDPASVTRELAGSSKASHGGLKEDFVSITRDIAVTVPEPAMKVGLAGERDTLRRNYSSLGILCTSSGPGELHGADVETALQLLNQIQHVQVTYGAVLLGFLGAVHWGLEFAKYGGEQGYKRLALGVAPVLYAWPTLSLTPEVALAAQWAGFTALWWADSKATTAGWTPKWYSQYRFYLSILVGSCIIGTLAGTNYFGPASSTAGDHGKLCKLDQVSAKGSLGGLSTKGGRKEGELSAEKTEGIEALPAEEGSNGYVIIKKKDTGEGQDGDKGDSGDKKQENQTNDSSKQDTQAKKDKGQQQGKAGAVRSGENLMKKDEKK